MTTAVLSSLPSIYIISVITELEGLAKGQTRQSQQQQQRQAPPTSSEHAQYVREQAALTVAYLEQQFGARHGHLRAMTSQGTQLDSIAFRTEEIGDKVSSVRTRSVCGLCRCEQGQFRSNSVGTLM